MNVDENSIGGGERLNSVVSVLAGFSQDGNIPNAILVPLKVGLNISSMIIAGIGF